MIPSSALPSFPLDMIVGPGLAAGRAGASLRLDLVDTPFATSGTGVTYRVVTGTKIARLALGMRLMLRADRDNVGEALLAVDDVGPVPLLDSDGSPLFPGLIKAGMFFVVRGDPDRGWLLEIGGAGISSAGIRIDETGSRAGRAVFDLAPKGLVYLAIEETADGPAWTLYTKRSIASGDWSSGLLIRATPAQSTRAAQGFAADASTSAGESARQAGLSADQAGAAATARTGAETARGFAEAARDAAGVSQQRAAASVVEAAYLASQVGALLYDMGTLDQPSDGSANFDFGSL
jgi:hypothetical protein